MKRDPVDIMLQWAFLEGQINTHGLYEKTVARRKIRKGASPEARKKLHALLEAGVLARKQLHEVPLTVGIYLKKARLEQSMRPLEVSSRVGLTQRVYHMLEEDQISPVKVSPEAWKQLRRLFRLPVAALADMIRSTHRLVFFQPSFQTTLARYKETKGRGKKSHALKSAARELYARADLPLPAEEEQKLSDLLKAISK